MSNQQFRAVSNAAVHGVKFAFDAEYARFKRQGCSDTWAFAMAASIVFGRYVK